MAQGLALPPRQGMGGELVRIGLSGAAHLLRCKPAAVNNWSKLDSFPKPILRAGKWREWHPEEIEAWATANWEGRPALRTWAEEKGYLAPTDTVPERGVPAEEWDLTAVLRKVDVARLLGFKQASGGRVFLRRDFPPPLLRNPLRWDAAAVLSWAQEHAHIKSLENWVDSDKNKIPSFSGYVIQDIANMVGLSTRATYGLIEKDLDFPLEIAPGGWDRAEVDSWKASHFDLPDYPYKRA